MKYLFKIILLLFCLIGVLFFQVKNAVFGEGPLIKTESIVIDIGSNSRIVGELLQQQNIIKNALLFKVLSKLYGLDKTLKAGEYEFYAKESLFAVMQKISNGDVIYRKITLAEGLTAKQMLDIIAGEEMLSGDITLDVKEGAMLPETYSFVRGDAKDSIIERAVQAMDKALEDAWNNRAINSPLRNKHELLTLASIVEKETGLPQERGLVASVFINRLTKGMKLQTDPTVIYALTLGQKELGRLLTKKDLAYDSPYNTYIRYGLPPTPICSPGIAALKATANPEVSNYLYFVASGNGGHNFSATLKQHNDNVAAYRRKNK